MFFFISVNFFVIGIIHIIKQYHIQFNTKCELVDKIYCHLLISPTLVPDVIGIIHLVILLEQNICILVQYIKKYGG